MFWVTIFLLILGLIAIATFMILDVTGVIDKRKRYIRKYKDYNKPYKCDCGIVSRKYQIINDANLICPHCSNRMYDWKSNMVKDDREFPFAPKINKMEFRKIIAKEKEVARIKDDLWKLEEYDKEVEAWERIQLKKMEEYQRKAEQIKKELESGKCGTSNII